MNASGDHNLELERRFLVEDPTVINGHDYSILAAAYLFVNQGWAVRVRRTFHPPVGGGSSREGPATLTVKGPRRGLERPEYEWEVPSETARNLFIAATWKVFKSRYDLVDSETTWSVDVFHFANDGLVIAECEMGDRTTLADVTPPVWCGTEITDDARYNNESLAVRPFAEW